MVDRLTERVMQRFTGMFSRSLILQQKQIRLLRLILHTTATLTQKSSLPQLPPLHSLHSHYKAITVTTACSLPSFWIAYICAITLSSSADTVYRSPHSSLNDSDTFSKQRPRQEKKTNKYSAEVKKTRGVKIYIHNNIRWRNRKKKKPKLLVNYSSA